MSAWCFCLYQSHLLFLNFLLRALYCDTFDLIYSNRMCRLSSEIKFVIYCVVTDWCWQVNALRAQPWCGLRPFSERVGKTKKDEIVINAKMYLSNLSITKDCNSSVTFYLTQSIKWQIADTDYKTTSKRTFAPESAEQTYFYKKSEVSLLPVT